MSHKFKCIYCPETTSGLACTDPAHQAAAANEVAFMEAGIPPFEAPTPNRRRDAKERLTEKPIGFVKLEAVWNGA